MPKFNPRTKTVQVRGQDVTVQEMTGTVRDSWLARHKENPQTSMFYLMAHCSVTPKWTEDEAKAEPADVIDAVVNAILDVSNEDHAKKGKNGKEEVETEKKD